MNGPKHSTPKPFASAPEVKAPAAGENVVQTAHSLNVGGPVGAVEPIGLAEDLLGAPISGERSPAGLRNYGAKAGEVAPSTKGKPADILKANRIERENGHAVLVEELHAEMAALKALNTELLEPLKELLEHIEWRRRSAGETTGPNDCTHRARAAISKVEKSGQVGAQVGPSQAIQAMKFRYFVIDPVNGTTKGTNDAKLAEEFGNSDEHFVIDAMKGEAVRFGKVPIDQM